MGATLQQIAEYLDERGLPYREQPQKARLVTRARSKHAADLLIVIQLDEEGRFFKLFVPEVLAGVKDHPFKAAILQTMLSISWETKMLQWEYDPLDGEIRAIIEFPLEDSVLTQRQFNRCFDGLIEIVDDWAMPRLLEVMMTGIDPGDEDLMIGERLLLAIQEEAPGMLDLLEKAMEARKRRGQFPPCREPQADSD
ncbi:hypothetical protein GS597_13990 [Synechococcales cyanobacterium C]|uniref:YbjN domain-containing protein n=1 Tax=Petrachloros mirabilis ULC683 TaxID=2781853 RepID=A0A8K2A8V7_9CYAN|nr:hypothetical protein [Petrachloros mirabilis]NCJ07599.1 hypothetical protein [Petrachloros mirabilis ULC683]